MDLLVGVEAQVLEHDEPVVAVGALTHRRKHDPAGGNPSEYQGVDVVRAQHEFQVAAGERAHPLLGDDDFTFAAQEP